MNSLSQLGLGKKSGDKHTKQFDHEYVKECLIDLYLSVKIRTNHDLSKYSNRKMQEEKEQILAQNTVDIPTLILYIQTSIQILMNMKDEEIFQNFHFRNLCQKCQNQFQRYQHKLEKNLANKGGRKRRSSV